MRTDKFSTNGGISDVIYDSKDNQYAPATRVVTCQGQIIKINTKDDTNYDFNVESTVEEGHSGAIEREFNIPQIDVNLYYTKVVDKPSSALDARDIHGTIAQTPPFSDGNVIKLIRNDLVVYAEELNTELLTENYEIEIFEAITGSANMQKLERKQFENIVEQVVDGFMVLDTEKQIRKTDYTTDAVEYFFDVLTDSEVSDTIACACASNFNKDSYYVELDHDCEAIGKFEELYYDIYGSVTVPEICDTNYDNRYGSTSDVTDDLEEKDSIEFCDD